MKDMDMYTWIANIILLVGGINLGIYGLIGIDLITAILGNLLGRLIFIVIGAAAGYHIWMMYKDKMKKSSSE